MLIPLPITWPGLALFSAAVMLTGTSSQLSLLGIILDPWKFPFWETWEVLLAPWEWWTDRVHDSEVRLYARASHWIRLKQTCSGAHVFASSPVAHLWGKPPEAPLMPGITLHALTAICVVVSSPPTLPKMIYCLPSNPRPFWHSSTRENFSWSIFYLCLLEILGWKILQCLVWHRWEAVRKPREFAAMSFLRSWVPLDSLTSFLHLSESSCACLLCDVQGLLVCRRRIWEEWGYYILAEFLQYFCLKSL